MKNIKEQKETRERLYIAYGSNLNLGQMARRCPTAEAVGSTVLRNWRLVFRGGEKSSVATIERETGSKVPVLVWQLQSADEHSLDIYEGCPHLYHKETLRVTLAGRRVYAMVYIMNPDLHPYGRPSFSYLNTIREGYKTAGFDLASLERAVRGSKNRQKNGKMSAAVREQILSVRETGETNMFDVHAVQAIANRRGFHELVVYLEEHRKEYANFILTGDTTGNRGQKKGGNA